MKRYWSGRAIASRCFGSAREIDAQARGRFDARQREALLREQLKSIREELGESRDSGAETAVLAAAITSAGMPPEAEERHARKELSRLDRMPEAATEYSMLHTYLEWLTEMP